MSNDDQVSAITVSPNEPQRIAIFVDVQNIYYTVKECYRRHFDYRKFWREIESKGEIANAYAYAIDRGDPKQAGFQQTLRDIGFEVKLKPYIQRRDGSSKGDWDVGITLDIYECAASVDVIVLLSGDGDFSPLLERIKQRFGVLSHVYAVEKLCALSLQNSADKFIAINGEYLLN